MFAPDASVLTWLAGHRTVWATKLSSLVMSAGTSVPALGALGVLTLIVIAVRHRWAAAVVLAAAAATALVVTSVLKALIGRPRPPVALALVHTGGFSMPSTDGAVTAAAALALLLSSTWSSRNARRVTSAGLAVVVALVGACLVYLGAHWPSDVLAGWAVGALSAWGCDRALRWMRRRLADRPVLG